ncbi:hypothetical protein [Streptococcus cuniculi]|uniref:ECF transporter S component n=1 Tax=Streptococcus cuniculi TaxID=1432788 RepID=A0A4Y9JEH9_9STRE|nr:hypothetical protein [Streptococcus cuniculi]MBF0777370.1 hypothetical protein [Streptococcus cuniculi]TFU98971.1 hypothetical protein E4T82_01285 [Streptococcus cuniculi]
MSTRRISQIALLTALAIVLRFAFAALPNIKPISAIFLVSLCFLPLGDSLWIMALTMLGSSLLFGFSFVVFWQIASFSVVMLLWRLLVIPLIHSKQLPLGFQCLLAGLIPFLYGFAISLPIAWQYGTNPLIYWLYGLSFDVLHSVSTVLFYPIIYSIFRRYYPYEKIST